MRLGPPVWRKRTLGAAPSRRGFFIRLPSRWMPCRRPSDSIEGTELGSSGPIRSVEKHRRLCPRASDSAQSKNADSDGPQSLRRQAPTPLSQGQRLSPVKKRRFRRSPVTPTTSTDASVPGPATQPSQNADSDGPQSLLPETPTPLSQDQRLGPARVIEAQAGECREWKWEWVYRGATTPPRRSGWPVPSERTTRARRD